MKNVGTKCLRKLAKFRQLEKDRHRFVSKDRSPPFPLHSLNQRSPLGPPFALRVASSSAIKVGVGVGAEQTPWPGKLSPDLSDLTKWTKWT